MLLRWGQGSRGGYLVGAAVVLLAGCGSVTAGTAEVPSVPVTGGATVAATSQQVTGAPTPTVTSTGPVVPAGPTA